MTGLVVGVVLVAVAVLAPRYGVDSRDGRDWSGSVEGPPPPRSRHTVGSDLRALAGLLRRAGRWLAQRWDAQERAWAACWRAHQPWRGDDLPPTEDELHWREEDGGWRLRGRLLPPLPPAGEPSSEPSARRD